MSPNQHMRRGQSKGTNRLFGGWWYGRSVAAQLDGRTGGGNGRTKFEAHHRESAPAVLHQDLSQEEFPELGNDEAVALGIHARAHCLHFLEIHDRAKNGSVQRRLWRYLF